MSYIKTAAYDHDAVSEPCSNPAHVLGCPCNAGGDIAWADRGEHDEAHPEQVEGCGECDNRAERVGMMWQRMGAPY